MTTRHAGMRLHGPIGRLQLPSRPLQGRPASRQRLAVLDAVVGIDLGTTNSAVAAVSSGQASVVRAPDGSNCTPSVVAVTEYDQTVVGQEALQGCASAQNTFYSFKRLMGRKLDEVLEEAGRLLYTVGEGDRGEALVYCPNLDDMISPEELSGWLLGRLLEGAEGALRERVTGAVITVPAHFDERQKGATLEAARLAGLPPSRVQLLQEPVAAALAYGIGGGTDGETVLVFDVGGGTYDVSILQAFEGILEVLGTAGDARLGGDDFDAALADWLLQQGGAGDRQWALRAAEQAKMRLSNAESTQVQLPGGGALLLTQQQLESITAGLFERLAAPLALLGRELFVEWAVEPAAAVPGRAEGSSGDCSNSSSGEQQQARQQAQQWEQHKQQPGGKWAAPPRRISRVVMVGQSTRMPALQRFVARVTGVAPDMRVDPAEAVALGAAIQAGVLLGELGSVELMDGSYSSDLHDRATGFGGGSSSSSGGEGEDEEWQEPGVCVNHGFSGGSGGWQP